MSKRFVTTPLAPPRLSPVPGGPWNTADGRRCLADYLAEVNGGVSVRGTPTLLNRIQRMLYPSARILPPSRVEARSFE